MEVVTGPRHAEITPFDHGALIQIPAWFLMVVVILITFLKLTIRFKATRNPGLDDAFCVVGMFFVIGQVITISLAVNDGLGRVASFRDPSLESGLKKELFASSILYIISLTLIKLAALIFITRLAVRRIYLIILWATMGLVTAWGLAGTLAFSFQCGVSSPWNNDDGRCFDLLPFWYGMGAVDILTDLLIILIPQFLVWSLQMGTTKKAIVALAFASRFIVIVAAVIRLIYLGQLSSATDYLFDYVAFATSTQCQLAFSVVATCLPSLKPFVDRTTTGMLNVSVAPLSGATYGIASYNNNYQLVQLSKSKGDLKSSESNSHSGSKTREESKDYGHAQPETFRPERLKHKVVITSDKKQSRKDDTQNDMSSLESSASKKMIVRLRRDFSVHSDEQPYGDNVSRRTNSENLPQDVIHAQSPV